jgi:predicted secreted protein
MTLIKGSDLLVKFGTSGSEELIYCSTSCTLNLSQEKKTATCKTGNAATENWETGVEGKKSWTIDVEGLYAQETDPISKGFVDLADLIITGPNKTSVVFGVFGSTGDITWTGEAMLTSAVLTGPADDNATWTCSFSGLTALTKAVES